jgi:TonB family protein
MTGIARGYDGNAFRGGFVRSRGFLLFAFVFLAICLRSPAQEVVPVDEPTLDLHVSHRVAPVYPEIARAAGVQGTVVFEIQVGTTGKVESINVVSGPAMLQQAAMDSVKQWTFYPFEKDGAPVSATGPVFIELSPGNDAPAPVKDVPAPDDDKIADRYFPASEECRKGLAGTDYKAAFTACKGAADIAGGFAPDRRFIEKRSAFVSAAWASMYGGYMKAALSYAGKAVDVVKLGHDDNAGSSAAYGVKGVIEGKLGFLPDADQDLTVSEDYSRKGITWVQKEAPSLIDVYKGPFVLDLRFHAQILQALDRSDEAQKKLDEAAKYD